MRGSVVKRTDKKGKALYYIKYYVGQRQKWETVSAPRTRKHADKLLAERLSQINRGEFIEPTKITFRAFKKVWMEKYAIGEGQIRPSTLTLYRGLFSKHMIPAFGDLPLAHIGVEDLQGFKAKMLKEGKMVKKEVLEKGRKVKKTTVTGLSPQTVKHMLRLFRQMFDHAIDWGYLRVNPAKKVRMPKVPKREMDCLTPNEVRAFLKEVPQRWYAFFLVAITTGLRMGELLAMRWENVSSLAGQYQVKETWLRPRGGNKAGFAPPKTLSSIAPVDLTPICLDALKEHKKRQTAERLVAGKDYQDNGLIFATSTGTPLDDSHIVQRVYRPGLTAAGIPTIRFHDLRHTCASLLIALGESPKYIQKQLRHASVDITFDRYGHLFPDANREAAQRLDDSLFGSQRMVVGRR
jgi:integrase